MKSNMEEIWKKIKGYEEYEISNLGRAKLQSGRITYGSKIEHGYVKITLCKKNKCKVAYIHRLVAEHFIENENNLHMVVNHVDENRENNNVTNLEWTTRKGNIEYSRGKHKDEWAKSLSDSHKGIKQNAEWLNKRIESYKNTCPLS